MPESHAAAESATDVIGVLLPDAPATFRLKTDQRVHGYLLQAEAGTEIRLDAESRSVGGPGLAVRLRGPRQSDGTFPALTVPEDYAPGAVYTAPSTGVYLAELSAVADASETFEPLAYELSLRCSGSCAAPEPAATIGLDIHWYRNSAEFRASALQTYRAAARAVQERAAGARGAWAVVSDIDETVLDNSLFQKERVELGVGYSAGGWTQFVHRRVSKALPGAVEYFRTVHELGGTVALISNRTAEECPDTERNLREQGIEADVVLCRIDTKEKEPRFEMVENGTAREGVGPAQILVFTGDNIEDFPDMDQTARLGDGTALSPFGTSWFLLANPMYGSFAGNPRD